MCQPFFPKNGLIINFARQLWRTSFVAGEQARHFETDQKQVSSPRTLLIIDIDRKLLFDIDRKLLFAGPVVQGAPRVRMNFIVTRENAQHVYDAAVWLRDAGVDNVRFSPVWRDDFERYHAPVQDSALDQLANCVNLETEKFRVYSSYRIDKNAQTCLGSRCQFQQVVSVIGADQNVYACNDQSYTATGRIGSIRGQKFSTLWFSAETKAWFEAFDPRERCSSIQCAAAAKNRIYAELVNAGGDNFV